MTNRFRRLLIRIGKTMPFLLCFLVFINYSETLIAMATSDYLAYDGMVIPNTRISFLVGKYFEYGLSMLIVLIVVSIAVDTCIWNKVTCAYLGANLYEKSFFETNVYDNEVYYAVCAINIILASYLTLKGIRILINNK